LLPGYLTNFHAVDEGKKFRQKYIKPVKKTYFLKKKKYKNRSVTEADAAYQCTSDPFFIRMI